MNVCMYEMYVYYYAFSLSYTDYITLLFICFFFRDKELFSCGI